LEAIFWIIILLVIYTYAGYPLSVIFLSLFAKKEVKKGFCEPTVTVLITAYNEENNIASKLEDTLSLEYPKEKMEIVVASDGSNDKTEEIVRDYQSKGVRLIRVEGRVGKTETQNQAVKQAKGEIIIFSDATTKYDKSAIRKIVRNYHDPSVGAVSGRYEYYNPNGAPTGMGTMLFWKYENFIKSRQTKIRTITGCCGCIYSVKKSLYEPLPANIISDLVEPLKILEKGYRIAFEPEAVAYEATEKKAADEFSMRVRVITRGMNGLLFVKNLFNPWKYNFVAFQLFSHKVLRWSIPFLMVGLLISNAFLLEHFFYRITFFLQVIFYAAAILGWIWSQRGMKIKILSIPFYFCLVNLASAIALGNIVKGRKLVTWETIRK